MLNAVKTRRSRIKPDRKSASLFLCTIVLMVPLVGAFPGLDAIELYAFGYLIPSQVIIVTVGAILLGAAYFVALGEGASGIRHIVLPILTLFGCMVLWGLICAWFSGRIIQRVSMQALWMVSPLLFAGFLVGIAKKRGIRFSALGEITVVATALFSLVLIAYNFAAYGPGLANGRLYCPGLGPVVLGYTNALVIALALSRKGANTIVPSSVLLLSVAVLLVAAFLTGSRGGIYPALALSIIYFLPTKNAAATMLLVLGAMTILLAFNPVEAFLSGRAGNLQSERYTTWETSFAVFRDGSPLEQIFGYGLGNVFPYQDWYTGLNTGAIERAYTDGAWNSFSFRGHAMLVEPHNTYIWLLLEGGVLSVIGYVICLILPLLSLGSSKGLPKLRFEVVVAAFMVLGVFDAVVFVNMASAFWWGVLLITFEASIELEGESG